ncbi:SGNH/GDSL hydrolase family protein [Flavobacterium sp. ALJ2]|uniref:SGNH/GDSL hydrolase family protein n=1 Tax=Flavobacterium sp. ALJ2 TaxID=2786960 RepID=UPI00189D3354|nr:SGNH/GDSL hydrolase family protein [Flavobacterium sp. ALJ2]MBF7092158.1 SGNH/GDSL hydrolase family protein [Flavobacterium sp. ALJ2]
MKNVFKIILTLLIVIPTISCDSESETPKAPTAIVPPVTTTPPLVPKTINYLALGDSYTIGQSVCETCNYPEQLQRNLSNTYPATSFSLKIIAKTGWTTSNLLSAINTENHGSNYDLVTLLIGVNNQFQNIPFSVYEKEFPELVNKAITLAKEEKSNVIVISIPDYAYTPFGQSSAYNNKQISLEIDKYNAFAENYCKNNNIIFISITDITRQGLSNPSLVTQDGLHPSQSAYTLFVERILPKVKFTYKE